MDVFGADGPWSWVSRPQPTRGPNSRPPARSTPGIRYGWFRRTSRIGPGSPRCRASTLESAAQLIQRVLKPLRCLLVAPAGAWENADRACRYGIESVSVSAGRKNDEARVIVAAPGDPQQEAPPAVASERHKQLSARSKAIEPEGSGMGRRGKGDDGIDLALIVRAPVVVDDFDLTPWAQVDARFGGELAVVSPGRLARRARRTPPRNGASADLHDPLAVLPVEASKLRAQRLGRPLLKPARLIDRHKGVMIEPGRVIIGRHEWVVGTAFGEQAGPEPRKCSRGTAAISAPTALNTPYRGEADLSETASGQNQ
jgi:hypothetical protein